MPLVTETSLHKVKLEISSHRQEIRALEKTKADLIKSLNAVQYLNVEAVAKTQLNMVKRDDSMRRPLLNVEKVSLEAAKKHFTKPRLTICLTTI